jgi:hypothetical protein
MCDPVVRDHRTGRAGGSLRDTQNNQIEAHEQNAHGGPSDGYAEQNTHGLYPRKDSLHRARYGSWVLSDKFDAKKSDASVRIAVIAKNAVSLLSGQGSVRSASGCDSTWN